MRLALHGIDRAFGAVQVLHGVDIALAPGEVHALVGENGAGKSTAMKIMTGYLAPTAGRVTLDGEPVAFASSQEAEARGVVLIHQEFNLALPLTVEQNVFLGHELTRGPFLDRRAMRERTAALLDRLDCRAAPTDRVADISNADKQMVEIAKALSRDARVLVMDEPTAVLTAREADVLFGQIERLRADGVAILFTSHKLDEVRRICDRVTVLRDGRVVARAATADMTEDAMATAMVGRDVSSLYPARTVPVGDEVVLSVRGLTVPGHAAGVDLDLRRGEILGLAGLIGSGRTEAMEGLVGLRAATGDVTLHGRPVRFDRPRAALDAGVAYLTEDRKHRGLILGQGMRENLTLQSLRDFTRVTIDRRAEEAALTRAIADFDIRAPHRAVDVGNLSGGNQQKLLLAKTMLADPEIVIVDEPTRGIDIGTKQQIYAFLHALVARGKSVIVISSEMQEVIGLADRVLVMRQGRIAGALEGRAIAEDAIVRLAMGVDAERAA